MKIAIVTDSVAYLSQEEVKQLGVYILPLSITYEDAVYVEGEDLTSSKFYDLVRGGKTLPKSSQPSIGYSLKLFEKLSREYDAAISIHLSGDISGTYQTVCSLKDEFESFAIHPIDSRRACGVQAQLVKEAVRLVNNGETVETILKCLNQMITDQCAYFLVDDLMHLQKGGRLSAGSALLGSMLNIKPILTIDGVITPTEKIRTFKKGMSRITELFSEHIDSYDMPFTVVIHHANRLDTAREWKDTLEKNFANIDVQIVEFGPVIGTHLGEKSVGLAFSPTTSNYLK